MAIHMMYVEMDFDGKLAGVAYGAGRMPFNVPETLDPSTIKACLKHKITSDSDPRMMLRKLEEMALETTGESISYQDQFYGTRDFEKAFLDLPRWICYGGKDAIKDREMIPKLLETYKAFVDSASGIPENGS